MYYIIQDNTFKEPHYLALIKALNRLELEHEVVQVLPFTEEIEFKTKRKDIIAMGSVKLARLGNLQGWNPGSFLNENHDYQVYSKFYGDNLLNFDSEIHCFADDFKWGKGLKFIRPCSDSKVFKAEVYDKYQWDETVERLLNNGHETTLTKKTPIQVCSVKKIYQEVRCWIVKGQVVTASQYVIRGRVVYSPCFDKDIIDFCHKMTEKFQLADAFVMDICRTESGLKIIECGCINAAGFYCADLQKLLVAFEDNFC